VDIATLIASNGGLSSADLDTARDALAGIGAMPGVVAWLDEGIAADLPFGRIDRAGARAVLEGLLPGVDVVIQPQADRRKKLLVADMDSTMITIECIDELADYAGIKPQIAEVTERAMRGELDFEAALDARVALLKGLEESAIERCHAERVVLMPGASGHVARERAEALREGVRGIDRARHDGHSSSVSISVGVAIFPEHAADREGLLQAADAALYRAKSSGRDRVEMSGGAEVVRSEA